MKSISGRIYNLGPMTPQNAVSSKSEGCKIFIWAALTTSLVACSAAPKMQKSPDTANNEEHILAESSTITAAPPPPNPKDPSADPITVSVANPTSPIIKNDSMGGEGSRAAEGDIDTDAVEEKQRARGTADPLQSAGNLEMGVEGGPAPGGSGIASNAKGARRVAGAAPAPVPDGSGAANTSGTQIAAASEVRGSIDKAEIRRVVMAHAGDIKRCYEQGLARRPDLEGRVTLKFTIGKTGTVAAVSVTETTLNDRATEQCIMRTASKWVFPKPSGDGLVTVSYPFILKSAD